jgi:CMP-N-acetylneuraminic acid synthetase
MSAAVLPAGATPTRRAPPKVLALVPARGGSKGLPRKNLLPLGGHPLIAWSVAAGRQATLVTRILCSTDDVEIAQAAQEYGAEAPFLRPPELALDDTPDLPVFQHALAWLEHADGWRADIVVQLRPTAPLRFPGQVDAAVRLLLEHPEATGVRAVVPAPANPFKMWLLPAPGEEPWMTPLLSLPGAEEPFNMPRQRLPQAYWQTGTIDVVRADVVRAGRMSGARLLPFLVDPRQAVDIDTAADMAQAAARIAALGCLAPGRRADLA